MDKQKFISDLQKELLNTSWDIKAESLLSLAIEKGLGNNDFLVCCNRFFKREFSKDLYTTDIKEDVKKQELLEVHLSRTGLYDQLPEGLFFQMPQRESKQITVNDLALDYKRNKAREEDIRRFFMPYDNGFFARRLQLEQEESLLLEGLQTGVLNDYFVKFWGLSPEIPKMFMIPLVLLLPHAHKIAGNLKLTAECLSYILKEKVRLVQKKSVLSQVESVQIPVLGDGKLGLDLVCGADFFEDNPVIEIQIGPLKNSKVKEYLEGGKRTMLLETFNRFFIPAGIDVITTIKLLPEKEDMLLEKGAEPILGYSTVLG